MNKFLEDYTSHDNITTLIGSMRVKKAFDVEIFDNDYGFLSIRVPEGNYTYRKLDFRGWKPTQICYDLEMNINNQLYKEFGWLDIAGYFNEEYVDTENIYSVYVVIDGVKEVKIENVDEEEAWRCYYNVISHMHPEEGVLKSVHLYDGGDDIDDYICQHESDKYNIINTKTNTYMNKGHEPLDLSDLKFEDDIDGGEDFELLKAILEGEDLDIEEYLEDFEDDEVLDEWLFED